MWTLHTLRRRANLPLSTIAQMTGIPVRRLADHEYNGTRLSDDDFARLALCFGVERQDLLAVEHQPAVATGRTPSIRWRQLAAMLVLALALAAGFMYRGLLAFPAMQGSVPQVTPSALPSFSSPGPTTAALLTTPVPPVSANKDANTSLARAAGANRTSDSTAAAVVPDKVPPPASTQTRPTVQGQPHQCPLKHSRGTVVVMHGYGQNGQSAPEAESGVDLAIDGDGNGVAEPDMTHGTRVVAAHDGIVEVELNTWPFGNQVAIAGADGWRTGYAHLASVYVENGQVVRAGQSLGVVGQTGRAGGPQLGFYVWHNSVNSDPGTYVACAGSQAAGVRGTAQSGKSSTDASR